MKLYLFLILTALGIDVGLLARGFTSNSQDYQVTGTVVAAVPAAESDPSPLMENIANAVPTNSSNTVFWAFGIVTILVLAALIYLLVSSRNQLEQEIHRRESLEVELIVHKTLDQLKNTTHLQVSHLVEKAEHKAILQQIMGEFGTTEEIIQKGIQNILG